MSARFTRRSAAILALSAATAALVPWVSAADAAGPEGGLDQRGWEMVSPADMNGGEVESPGGAGSAVFQAAAEGGALAYGSPASFGPAAGAAPVSQYLASRGPAAWGTVNLTPPLLSGTYVGGAYRLFSPGLGRAILDNGWSCGDDPSPCAVRNPPLAQGAPAGYRNLYLREAGQYKPLITTANAPALSLAPEDFELALEGASGDLGHAVVSSCAALTANAGEVPAATGCDPEAANLYQWSSSGSLGAVNLLPATTETAPGASFDAISADGSRVYWTGADGNLYLRKGGAQTVQVDATAGGGGEFQIASESGEVAYFIALGHLYRFVVATGTTTDLTPAGDAVGALGVSSDGSYIYFLASSGLYLSKEGAAATKIASGADLSNVPPATGTARVTPDGTRLAFVSSASLTGFINNGQPEVFLYEAPEKRLLCASCNQRGRTPIGPSSIPGAVTAGAGPASHKPRSLSADGTRVFFDSEDAIVVQDSDKAPDVYEWQARNTGGCQKAAGCIGLVSGGRSGEASFIDAGADATDVFFLTNVSLLPQDTGAFDIYDARAAGGYPELEPEIPCDGDACQGPAQGPEVPVPGTATLSGPPNPPLSFKKQKQKKAKKHRGKKHKKKQRKGKHAKQHRGGRK